MNNFESLNLAPSISKAIHLCGYNTPTPIQQLSIPEILLRKDLVATAQTGTGKTAAFVLPALHHLSMQKSLKKTRVLILTPTRELAIQIINAAKTYGKFSSFNMATLVGGMPYHQQIRELSRGADIIVATPGRLMDHMEQNRVNLSNIEMLILDEADRMLDMGFIDDVNYIAKKTPANRQTLMFSATVDPKLASIVRHLLKNPVRIDLSNEKVTAPQIKQELYRTTNAQHKSRLLRQILKDKAIFKAIIFSATKINADRLADELCDEGYSAAALHGDLKQSVRNRTIEQLRRGKIQFLVATDVAARGIDINDVTHVINYDMPRFCEDYVHRIGRTGRAGKSGIAISFVLPTDMRHLKSIERYIGQTLKLSQLAETGATSTVPVFTKKESFPSSSQEGNPKRREYKSHHSSASKKQDGFGKSFAPGSFKKKPAKFKPRHAEDSSFKKHHEDSPFKKRSFGKSSVETNGNKGYGEARDRKEGGSFKKRSFGSQYTTDMEGKKEHTGTKEKSPFKHKKKFSSSNRFADKDSSSFKRKTFAHKKAKNRSFSGPKEA